MSAATPIRTWWATWLSAFWSALRVLVGVAERPGPAGKLMRLALRPTTVGGLKHLGMIGFARWSIISRAPYLPGREPASLVSFLGHLLGRESKRGDSRPGPPGRERRRSRRLPYPYLLFESNFNGGTDEYLEAFSLIVPWGMRGTWGGAYNVPNPRRVGKFRRHVESATVRPAYNYPGYQASAKKVLAALELRRHLDDFSAASGGPPAPAGFRRSWDDLLTRVQTIRRPWSPAGRAKWCVFSSLAPVQEGREEELKQRLRQHLQGDGLLPDGRTHFARWVLFDEFQSKVPGQKVANQAFLLFSAWFDGTTPSYLRELHAQLGAERVLGIWEPCGLRSADVRVFVDLMRTHQVERPRKRRPKLFTDFAGYPGFTVPQVRCAVDLSERFRELMAASQTLADAALYQAWKRFEREELQPAGQVFGA